MVETDKKILNLENKIYTKYRYLNGSVILDYKTKNRIVSEINDLKLHINRIKKIKKINEQIK